MTFPVKQGDVGILHFSERDTTNYLTANGENIVDLALTPPLGLGGALYPLCWEGEIFTASKNPDIDPINVVVQNEDSIFIIGTNSIDIVTTNYIKITNGSAIMEFQPSGDINANGATITSNGNVITANGANLDALWNKNWNHNHGGVASGSSDTGGNKPI